MEGFMTSIREIQKALGISQSGDQRVDGVSSLGAPKPHTLSFTTTWSPEVAAHVKAHPLTVFLVPSDAAEEASANCIPTTKPRLAYAQVLRDVLSAEATATIEPTAFVHPDAVIGSSVSI